MTPGEIQTEIRDFIIKQFPAARARDVSEQDSLLDGGIVDSLGILEIVTFMEERFQILLTDDELVSDHFGSISSLADLVGQKLGLEESCSR